MQLSIVHMYIQVDVHACHMFNLGLSDYGTHVEHNISRNTLCPQSTHITVSMDVDTQHIHTYKGYVANHWYLSENQRLLHSVAVLSAAVWFNVPVTWFIIKVTVISQTHNYVQMGICTDCPV